MLAKGVRLVLLLPAFALQILGVAPAAASETTDDDRTAKVIYISGALAYIDAGRDDGLREGDTLEVLEDDGPVTTIVVTHLSSHRAACTIVDLAATPEPGDLIRYTPHHEPLRGAAIARDERTSARKRSGDWGRRIGLRGRVGLRYLAIRDRADALGNLSQPGIDLRLDGNDIGGSHIGLAADVRTQRDYTTLPDGSQGTADRTRVYRMAVSWFEPRSGLTMALGRQYSHALSPVSVFDGLLVDLGGTHWNFGLFSGTEPDPIDYSYSSEIREHGIYTQFHNAPLARKRWALTLGAVGSYANSEINREFVFLQSRYSGPVFSFFLAQEVDYNRDWKAEVEGTSVSPSSTFANFQVRATRHLTFRGGYDNRRRVRLYRDRVTPESEFDDANRLGATLGWSWGSRHFQVSMDGRRNAGDATSGSESYTMNLGALSLSSQSVSVVARGTYYGNEQAEGWLYSLRTGTNIGRRVRVDLTGGRRDEKALVLLREDSQTTWVGVDLSVNLGRHWYLLVSAEQNQSDLIDNVQLFSSLTYRF